jgi:hypothetical protein
MSTPSRKTYAFTVAAEIESDKEFKDIPINELCWALRCRIDRVELVDQHEALDCFDKQAVD